MPRGVKIGLITAVVLCVGLATALAMIGSRFDQVRIERDDLDTELQTMETESDSLQAERDALAAERDSLSKQIEEQLKTIEQLKGELRARGQGQPAAQPQSSNAPATP